MLGTVHLRPETMFPELHWNRNLVVSATNFGVHFLVQTAAGLVLDWIAVFATLVVIMCFDLNSATKCDHSCYSSPFGADTPYWRQLENSNYIQYVWLVLASLRWEDLENSVADCLRIGSYSPENCTFVAACSECKMSRLTVVEHFLANCNFDEPSWNSGNGNVDSQWIAAAASVDRRIVDSYVEVEASVGSANDRVAVHRVDFGLNHTCSGCCMFVVAAGVLGCSFACWSSGCTPFDPFDLGG